MHTCIPKQGPTILALAQGPSILYLHKAQHLAHQGVQDGGVTACEARHLKVLQGILCVFCVCMRVCMYVCVCGVCLCARVNVRRCKCLRETCSSQACVQKEEKKEVKGRQCRHHWCIKRKYT